MKEETGLDIENVQYLTATNDVMPKDGKHYVTVFVGAKVKEGQEPEVSLSERTLILPTYG